MALFGGNQESGDPGKHKGVAKSGSDAARLVVAYVKQETVGPLKELGRFLGFGIAGSILLAAGAILFLIGTLRILQTETGAFHGNLSWLPYLIVGVMASVIIGAAAWRIAKGPAARRRPPATDDAKG